MQNANHFQPEHLLTADQIWQFLSEGYLVLDPQVSPEIHAKAREKLDWVLKKEGNPGNNVLPAVPELQDVLDSPVICGATF